MHYSLSIAHTTDIFEINVKNKTKNMNNILFKAETIKGETIEACCVINKHERLLLSNEAKAGFWIECKPGTLQVINKTI